MRGARAVQHIRYDQACAGSWRVRVSGQHPTPATTTLSIQISGPGVLTDGFDSTSKSMRTRFPVAHRGHGLRHALNKLPAKLTSITSPVCQALRSQFHTLLYRARQRKGLRVFALG